MKTNRREAARRKLLGILPRSALEDLSGIERPWHSSRSDLTEQAIARWMEDEIREAIESLFRIAAG